MGLQPGCLPGPKDARETGKKPPLAAAVERVLSKDWASHIPGGDQGALGILRQVGRRLSPRNRPGWRLLKLLSCPSSSGRASATLGVKANSLCFLVADDGRGVSDYREA